MSKEGEVEKKMEWPPAPEVNAPHSTHLKLISSGKPISSEKPSSFFIGLLAGCFLYGVIAFIVFVAIIFAGTIIQRASQYGHIKFSAALETLINYIWLSGCQVPAFGLFMHFRWRRRFLAYGLLMGSILGMVFLIVSWYYLRPHHIPSWEQ